MWGALAHQIGCPQKAVGTGGDFGGFGSKLVVGFADAARVCRKSVAEPAQREAGGLRDAHDVPASGDGVAEGVDATAGIERWAIGGGKNDAGRANRGADRSSGDDAHAGGASGLVTCARYNRSTNAKSCFRSPFAGNLSADTRRFVERGQQTFVDFGGLQHLLRPAAMSHGEKQRAGSVGHIGGAFAGEAKADVVLGKHNGADALPVFGFVLADPQ